MYEASITFHQGSQREFGHDQRCATLQEAVETIENWASGMGDMCRAWINNREVRVQACRVVDDNGDLICTNPKWHELFAKPNQKISPLRPVPTNQATPGFMDGEDRRGS